MWISLYYFYPIKKKSIPLFSDNPNEKQTSFIRMLDLLDLNLINLFIITCLGNKLVIPSSFIISGKKWKRFSVFTCNECYNRAKSRHGIHDRSSYNCWCLLLWLQWGAWLEIWKSLWGNSKVQGRQIHTWEV